MAQPCIEVYGDTIEEHVGGCAVGEAIGVMSECVGSDGKGVGITHYWGSPRCEGGGYGMGSMVLRFVGLVWVLTCSRDLNLIW